MKLVDKGSVSSLEQAIAMCNRSIHEIREMARGTADGLKLTVGVISQLKTEYEALKNKSLDSCDPNAALLTQFYRGQEKAFDKMLSMFTNPEDATREFIADRERYEAELAQLRAKSVREQRS